MNAVSQVSIGDSIKSMLRSDRIVVFCMQVEHCRPYHKAPGHYATMDELCVSFALLLNFHRVLCA